MERVLEMKKKALMLIFSLLFCMVSLPSDCLADYDSKLLPQISEDIPYSKMIEDLIVKPHSTYSDGNFSISIDEYIYDGCNLFVLYTVSSSIRCGNRQCDPGSGCEHQPVRGF